MDSIPQEILLNIFARLDLKSLANLCLVSKLMQNLSYPLLFQNFEGGFSSTQCLRRLRNFCPRLLKDPSLANQVRSVDISEATVGELPEDMFKLLLKHTPNLRHLDVPGDPRIAEFLNDLLKDPVHLRQLRSFNYHPNYWSSACTGLLSWLSVLGLKQLSSLSLSNCKDAGYHFGSPSIPPELQGNGGLSLRHLKIENSRLGYSTLARLIQSCKRLEEFNYDSPLGYCPRDSNPATIIQALLLHKDSLEHLAFEFRSRNSGEDFDQVPKLISLEEFSCLESLWINQDCLPWKPLLPSSLEVLSIESPDSFLEPALFHNLRLASHSSLKSLSKLYVTYSYSWGYPKGIFDGFDSRVLIMVDGNDD
ncbi:hypothetical protein BJY01DRAFT_213237 [Aspergillus pseudoustus]|uniref:F-box domain-containing protein n=1 Tax=Aspergillus pseudoustus TaxID=1810923 RepID=A0ABR4K2R7_9EURO